MLSHKLPLQVSFPSVSVEGGLRSAGVAARRCPEQTAGPDRTLPATGAAAARLGGVSGGLGRRWAADSWRLRCLGRTGKTLGSRQLETLPSRDTAITAPGPARPGLSDSALSTVGSGGATLVPEPPGAIPSFTHTHKHVISAFLCTHNYCNNQYSSAMPVLSARLELPGSCLLRFVDSDCIPMLVVNVIC